MRAAQFAKEVGVTRVRVSHWIRDEILKKSVKRLRNGWYEIDERLARKELEDNLNRAYPIKSKLKKKRKTKKPKDKKPAKKNERLFKESDNETSLSEARRRKEVALAQKHELELEILRKKYVEADDVKQAWTRHIGTAKTKLLAIRPELTPIIREMIDDLEVSETILQTIDNKIEGVLSELAKSNL